MILLLGVQEEEQELIMEAEKEQTVTQGKNILKEGSILEIKRRQ